MRLVHYLLVILLTGSWFSLSAQDLEKDEQILFGLLNELRQAQTDDERFEKNASFKEQLDKTIRKKGAFEHGFTSLRSLGSITSPDGAFRFFNWNVELEDESQMYYCYILTNDVKGNNKVIELKDNSYNLMHRTQDVLDQNNWYGALYYKIIPIKRSGKTVYTILGWDGNNSASSIKIIDVLTITGSSARLGSPIFKMPKETLKRVYFEFAKKTTMFLNYEEKYNRIIFDHLAPETPALTGMYSMYVPDLSHDAFVMQEGKWFFVEDVVGINEKGQDQIRVEYVDDKTGEIKTRVIKNKWQEPSKEHVATLPEDAGNATPVDVKGKEVDAMRDRKAPGSYVDFGKTKKKKRKK